jgi:hypothetical protein
MGTIRFAAYLLYRYYSKGGTKDIPYASAILALAFMGLIHIFQILLLFNGMSLVPTDGSQAKVGNFLKMGLFILPIVLLLMVLVKKDKLQEMAYDETQMKRGYIFLILYIVLSFALLLLLIYYRKGKIV